MDSRRRSVMSFRDKQMVKSFPLISGNSAELADQDGLARLVAKYQLDDIRVEDIELSPRTHNCLGKLNIKDLAEALFKTPEYYMKSGVNMGRKSIDELRERAERILENPWAYRFDNVILLKGSRYDEALRRMASFKEVQDRFSNDSIHTIHRQVMDFALVYEALMLLNGHGTRKNVPGTDIATIADRYRVDEDVVREIMEEFEHEKAVSREILNRLSALLDTYHKAELIPGEELRKLSEEYHEPPEKIQACLTLLSRSGVEE